MAVQTPTTNSTYDIVMGSLRVQLALFASISNNDTFKSDLGTIVGFSCDGGNTATCGLTYSGSTVTFAIGSGPATNVSLLLYGF